MLFGDHGPAVADEDWEAVRETHQTLAALDGAAWERLRAMAAQFLERKSIEPVQGLEMDAAARAAVAAGADGILVEVHPDPDGARCDGPQSLSFDAFEALTHRCRIIATTLGRRISKGA